MKKILLLIWLGLAACTTNQPLKGNAVDEMNVAMRQGIEGNEVIGNKQKRIPSSEISRALMPDIKIRSPGRNYAKRKFDLAVKDVPATTFYTGLVTDTPYSIVVSPEIKGNITLNLKQVTIEQVLQTLEDVYGYAFVAIPGGYEILPNLLKTKIYPVNYIELERKGRSSMQLTSGEVTQFAGTNTTTTLGGSTSSYAGQTGTVATQIGDVETKSTVNFWKQLEASLVNMIGNTEGHSVTINPIAGVVVIRATPKELKQVEMYLDMVQNHVNRQVLLDAKILEVRLNNQYQMGIDWKIFGAQLNSLTNFQTAGINIDPSTFPDAYVIDVHWANSFQTTIKALETQGTIEILSSPRVATMNNQKSLIKVGNDSFFVTNVTNNTNVTTLGTTTNAAPSVNLTPFFSGITLDVTPQIDSDENITLHIHPSVSLVQDQRKEINLGSQGGILDLPLALSYIRESDTIVHSKSGQVVVIGGLTSDMSSDEIAELPFFGNIPFLGTLFRATKDNKEKIELVILIKATILNPRSAQRELIDNTQRIANVKRGFHISSRPDIFGTEGEEPVVYGPPAGEFAH